MSIVVFDGKTLAADCLAVNSGLRMKVNKIFREPNGTLLAFTGQLDAGLIMVKWFQDGADLACYPPFQAKEDWTRLIVVHPTGEVVVYEQHPVGYREERSYAAWGCGRDFAMGALAMGADARRAVEITNELSEGCGFGIEACDLRPLELVKTGD